MQFFREFLCKLFGHSDINIGEGKHYSCARCGTIVGDLKHLNGLLPIIIFKDGFFYSNYAYKVDLFDGENHSGSFDEYINYYFGQKDLWLIDSKLKRKLKFLFENHEVLPLKNLFTKKNSK